MILSAVLNIQLKRLTMALPLSEKSEELQEDMKLLLDCLRYQRDSVPSQKQALTTIAGMCSTHCTLRDTFRIIGGLQYISDLLVETASPELQVAAMYALGCACEENLVTQRTLSNLAIFSFLEGLLNISNKVACAVKVTAGYLVTCIMNGNINGQNLSRDTHVLETLITLYKSYLPAGSENQRQVLHHEESDSEMQDSSKLWISASSALCAAVNNPQNETNQNVCSQILPAALSIVSSSSTFCTELLRSAATVISACVANNDIAQDRLRLVGGLNICVEELKKLTSQSMNLQQLVVANQIVKILFTASSNSQNCRTLSSLDVVAILLKLLQVTLLDTSTKLNAVTCIGLIVEGCTKSQMIVKELGLPVLIDLMAESKNEELSRTATLVMKSCLEPTGWVTDALSNTEEKLVKKYPAINSLSKPVLQDIDEAEAFGDHLTLWMENSNVAAPKDQLSSQTLVKSSSSSRKDLLPPAHKGGILYQPQIMKHSAVQLRPTVRSVPKTNSTLLQSDIGCCTSEIQKKHAKCLHCVLSSAVTTSVNNQLHGKASLLSTKQNIRYGHWNKAQEQICSAKHCVPDHGAKRSTSHYFQAIENTTATQHNSKSQSLYNSMCPGCTPSVLHPLLTSRNFLSYLQCCKETCILHKQMVFAAIKQPISVYREFVNTSSSHRTTETQAVDPVETCSKFKNQAFISEACDRKPNHYSVVGCHHCQSNVNATGNAVTMLHDANPLLFHRPLRSEQSKELVLSQEDVISDQVPVRSPQVDCHSMFQCCKLNSAVSVANHPASWQGKTCKTIVVEQSKDPSQIGDNVVQDQHLGDLLCDQQSQYEQTERPQHFLSNTMIVTEDSSPRATQLNERSVKKKQVKDAVVVQRCTKADQAVWDRYDENVPPGSYKKGLLASNDKAKEESINPVPSANIQTKPNKQVPQRRVRVKFTDEEKQNLIAGVKALGKRWRHIRSAYNFNPCRTTVDLKDQYRILHAKGSV